MDIIDFHVHAGNFHKLRDDIQGLLRQRPVESDIDVTEVFSKPALMEKYLRRNGVTKAVVLAECGPGTCFSIDSEMIANFTKDNDFFVPFGSINPNYHQVQDEWEKSLELGVEGFKFYPADHSFNPLTDEMMQIYSNCEEHNLVVMFHTGLTAQRDTKQEYIRPSVFTPIIDLFPNLPVVFAHGGKPNWHDEAIDLMLNNDNVYMDTGLVSIETVTEIIKNNPGASSKILYGSDWPIAGSYSKFIESFVNSEIPEDDLKLVLHDNAASLFSLLQNASNEQIVETV